MNLSSRVYWIACLILLITSNRVCNADTPNGLLWDISIEATKIDITTKDIYDKEATLPMPVFIFRPRDNRRHPFAILNHGRPEKNLRFTVNPDQYISIACYLISKDFVVAFPIRIGYGPTADRLDPEDTGECISAKFEPMKTAVRGELTAVVAHMKTLPYVDATHWISIGGSAGGLASLILSGQNPEGFTAGINFSGGVGGDGYEIPGNPCSETALRRFIQSTAHPTLNKTLWLYWKNDMLWGQRLPKEWFAHWVDAGGNGTFLSFDPVGEDGHKGMMIDMAHWRPVVDAFLNEVGFSGSPSEQPVAGSATTELADQNNPALTPGQLEAYRNFAATPLPHAFSASESGGWAYSTGGNAVVNALLKCLHHTKSNSTCRVYAAENTPYQLPSTQ